MKYSRLTLFVVAKQRISTWMGIEPGFVDLPVHWGLIFLLQVKVGEHRASYASPLGSKWVKTKACCSPSEFMSDRGCFFGYQCCSYLLLATWVAVERRSVRVRVDVYSLVVFMAVSQGLPEVQWGPGVVVRNQIFNAWWVARRGLNQFRLFYFTHRLLFSSSTWWSVSYVSL